MKTFHTGEDESETSLLFGQRVSKSDSRCEAYGTIDEAVSALGVARQFCLPEVGDIIRSVQEDLFIVGAELATPPEHYSKLAENGKVVTPEMVRRLENIINDLQARFEMPKNFIIPGSDSTGSAILDLARTVIRRAERRVVYLHQQEIAINYDLIKYLNRLASLTFTLARYQQVLEKQCK